MFRRVRTAVPGRGALLLAFLVAHALVLLAIVALRGETGRAFRVEISRGYADNFGSFNAADPLDDPLTAPFEVLPIAAVLALLVVWRQGRGRRPSEPHATPSGARRRRRSPSPSSARFPYRTSSSGGSHR